MLAAFSITPLGAGDSVSDSVAEAVRIVRASGLANETNAMFTNVEGEWDEVMDVLKQCVERVLEDAPRVSVTMKLDVRPGTTDALHDKVRAVEDHLA
ncbi:MAG TPA: MTH1187 family thiamine-binding protein [Acidimicrobiia bacterium]|jgi:uncharacterized protein (TIGR00106 family)